ncbi:MAG: HD domain-containing protein [Firmicutes bacterium]|nr:HD domain-containing protein [Bacillota bacterium]
MSLLRRIAQKEIGRSDQLYDLTYDLVKEIEEHVFSGDTSAVNIVDLAAQEEYLAVHSLNVTIMSLVMAYHNGFPNRVLEVGMGAMLHDVGMLFVDKSILQKEDPLEDEERQQIQSHVDAGLRILGGSPSWNAFSKVFILQHHERCDGSGYPRGFVCKDIHPVGRIAAIADTYSSLVYSRSFRKQMMPHQAIEIIMGMAGFELDFELVQSFCQLVVPYPVGTLVRLNNQMTAVVAAINKKVKTRPVLRLLTGPDGSAYNQIIELDLSDTKNQTIIIEEVISEG